MSIILTHWNDDRHLERALRSLTGLDHNKTEVIIIDDGSDLSSQKFLSQSIQNIIPWASFFLRDHAGVSAQRNFGASIASGQIIKFLDADDALIHNTTIRLVQLLIDNPKLLVAYGTSIFIDSISGHFFCQQQAIPKDNISNRNITVVSASAMKRSLFNEFEFCESVQIVEDWDLWIRIWLRHGIDVFHQTDIRG